jgi:methionyl-tRNA formyltransferase
MRVFLIIDETNFYQPDYIADLLRAAKNDHFVGCALVTQVLPKSNIEQYMIRNFYFLTLKEIFRLICKKIRLVLKNAFKTPSENGNFYSVQAVLEFFRVEYFKVQNDINNKSYISKIREFNPEIILSSNSLILGSELLSLAQYCINRHSALLPSYGGLWPVLHAISRGEKKVGVTIHKMTTQIDRGFVIAQEEICVEDHDTIDSLYRKCFSISSRVTIRALDLIRSGLDNNISYTSYPKSYFGFPTKKTWQNLRVQKRNFI